MKTRKVLFCLSAISLTLYTVWEILRQTPLLDSWYKEHIWGNPLRVELFGYRTLMWMNGFAFHDYVQIAGETLLVCIGIIWILLTFIAFFQLPNPRGYKIYNWVSLVLNICFSLGLFLSIYFEGNAKMETIGVVLGIIGFFSLVSYLTFTFIRAVLYRIPRDFKFEGIDAL